MNKILYYPNSLINFRHRNSKGYLAQDSTIKEESLYRHKEGSMQESIGFLKYLNKFHLFQDGYLGGKFLF